MHPAGVDGCRGGWAVAERATDGTPRLRVVARFEDLLARGGPRPLAIDVPIGLLDAPRAGGRPCDGAARKLLPGKASSVFSPPTRPALSARAWSPALGVSQQAFHLFPKIREVDLALRARRAPHVHEAHPELAFARLNGGRPVLAPKRSLAGRRARLALLARAGERGLAREVARARAEAGAAALAWDDALDAVALLSTAERIAQGAAERVGRERDARGLPMRIAW